MCRMKDLIRRILKEDFDWAQDIEPKKVDDYIELSAEVYTGKVIEYDSEDNEIEVELSDDVIESRRTILHDHLANHVFYDTKTEGNQIFLEVDNWLELTKLFEEGDSRYNVIYRSGAEWILDDDYNEPYDDVYINDWMDEVWSLCNEQTIKDVIDQIEPFVGDIVPTDDGDIEITKELLEQLSKDPDRLGEMVNGVDEFIDIRDGLTRSYHNAYNGVVYDNMVKACIDEIEGLLGKSKWDTQTYTDSNGDERTRHYLLFDISGMYSDVIDTYYQDYCDLDWDRNCDLEYSNFLDILQLLMYEDHYEDELTARYEEWPDNDDLKQYFNNNIDFW